MAQNRNSQYPFEPLTIRVLKDGLGYLLGYLLDYLLDYSLDYGLSKITHLCEKTGRKVIKKFPKGNKEIPER